MNDKQNWFETLKPDGKPERLCTQYQPTKLITSDPIYAGDFGTRKRGTNCKDWFGVELIWPEDQAGAMPGAPICPDVTCWKEYIKFPDVSAVNTGWEQALADRAAVDPENEIAMCFMGCGVLERLHFLLGFENALMSLLTEPEATMELIEAIGEYRFQYAKKLVEMLKPEAIVSHDDWGAKKSLFFSPEVFRTFFKPQYARIYGYLNEHNVKILHHADSYLMPIVEDMVDVGIDVWQGALPENDLVAVQKQLNGRMVVMGGIDASIVDRPDSTEEQIRAEVRRACTTYGPGGHFIPSLTYGRAGSIFPHVEGIIDDEIKNYNNSSR